MLFRSDSALKMRRISLFRIKIQKQFDDLDFLDWLSRNARLNETANLQVRFLLFLGLLLLLLFDLGHVLHQLVLRQYLEALVLSHDGHL